MSITDMIYNSVDSRLHPFVYTAVNRMRSLHGRETKPMTMNDREKEELNPDDPVPLTDEELAEFQRKEERKVGIIGTIIDFFLGFFT